jgi:hypothetical protein
MSGRQVCGQAPGDPAPFTIYKGMDEQTDVCMYAVTITSSWELVDICSIGNSGRW